jgi:hypothetical protein
MKLMVPANGMGDPTQGKRNPRDHAPRPDCLIPPAMQQAKQPFWVRLELLARLTLNAGSMPATSQLDWLSSTTAIIVLFWSRATRDLLRSFGWGIWHSIGYTQRRSCHPRRPPHSVCRYCVSRLR